MSCAATKNPLSRGGTGQNQRLLPGLQQGYVLVDEKKFDDWIVFAARFAEYIKFFDRTNTWNGTDNWKAFFSKDISAIAGNIAIQNISSYQQLVKERFDILRNQDHTIPERKEALGSLFGIVFTLAHQVDAYFSIIESGLSLKQQMQALIANSFLPALKKMIGYYKAAGARHLITEKEHPEWKVLNAPVGKAKDILNTGLSPVWYRGFTDWNAFLNAVAADEHIFGDSAWPPEKQVEHAARHNYNNIGLWLVLRLISVPSLI